MNENLLCTRQAAARLGISRRTLETLRQVGRGPTYLKLGSRVLYRPSQIDDWLTTLAVESTAQAKHVGTSRA